MASIIAARCRAILAQPIYRDALLTGKFLAGLATLAMSLAALWLLVIGFGLILLGVPPSGEEIARSLAFLVIAVFYAGVWLSLAMLFRSCSARRRRPPWWRSASGCS